MSYLQQLKYKFILLLLLVFSNASSAQSNYHVKYGEGIRIINAGYVQEAYRFFREMNNEYPDSLQVMHMLARIDYDRGLWKRAIEWYDGILDRNPKDLDARYFSGICYRETGKFKAFVLRKKDWSRAEENFQIVLDSLNYYKDLYLHYAILQNYRDNYVEAIELAETQISYQKSIKTGVFLHRFYDSFLHNKGLNDFEVWAATKTNQRIKLYLAEGHRLEKQYGVADSMLTKQLQDTLLDISPVPIYLSLSKSKIEQNQSDSCQFYFEQALNAIKNNLDAQLMFEHVKFILTNAEYEEYAKIDGVEARREFFNRLWVKRNPMPAAEVNYRIIEHVRRFAFAERNYYYDGFRLPFNNPDRLNILQFPLVFDLNDRLNDKGVVYIRHGDPDDRAFTVNAGPLNESWLYYAHGQLNKKLIFHFWQGETQTGQNWRFVASIPSYLAESRSNFDHLYSRLMMADPLESISIQHQMEIESKENIKIGLNSDQHTWTNSLRSIIFPFYMATFRQDHFSTRSEIYFSLTEADVLPRASKHGLDDSITINFAVFDDEYNELNKQLLRVPIRDIVDSTATIGYWPYQIGFVDAPSSRLLALNIRTPDDEAIGGYKFRFTLADYNGDNLTMSGIELAHSIRESAAQSAFSKDGLEVVPNPGKIFLRKENVNIYFEIYNIPIVQGRQTRFELDYRVRLLEERQTGMFAKVTSLFKRSQPTITNQIERTTAEPISREYLALDLGSQAPGLYELAIKAQLFNAPDSVSRKINFELK